ncbi:MAG: acyl-CoA dehydrogenase family protein [Kofleriaceae bacterium]
MTPRARELCLWLRDYAETRIDSVMMDERRTIPPHVVLDLGNRGLLGVTATAAYGGLELGAPEILTVFEQLGAIDQTLAIFLGIHNALGIRPIQRFGGDALKSSLLSQLASGRMIGALAMTERAAGSNARAIETVAIRDGDGFRVRGSKIWVGNGSWAGAITVFARRPPEEGGGMCGFTVPAGTPGLRMGAEALTTGMRAIVQNELALDVWLSRDNLLGIEGEGFAVAEDSFGLARIGIAAIALGGIRRAIQLADRYTRRRQISTGPLLANARTHDVLAGLVAAATAAGHLLRVVGEWCDPTGSPPPHLAAICKIVVPELLGRAVDRVIQLCGGRGYIDTSGLPQLARDARLLRIFEGPTETLEMHLGSAVLGNALAIDTLLEPFTAPQARVRLEVAIPQLATALEGTAGEARIVTGQRVKLAIGHVVAWGVLAAAAETAAQGDDLDALASRWALANLDARVARATLEPGCDREMLARAIDRMRDAIGDVEQTLPGADHALDPLLRRDG